MDRFKYRLSATGRLTKFPYLVQDTKIREGSGTEASHSTQAQTHRLLLLDTNDLALAD
jgi:hypothetical protein